MHTYSLLASAKINLYLEIIGDYVRNQVSSNFHELIMVLQSIELADQVDVRSNGVEAFRVHCSHAQVPQDSSNLAYRAAELMGQQFPDCFAKYGGVDITIQKRIPVGAGLAGGSANAAAVLVGIDLLWQLGLTQSELQELGATLGSDVPFCVVGGTALATGRGEQLDTLPDLENLYVVLAKYRSLSVSTAWAYQTFRKQFSATYCAPEDLECRRQRVHSGPMMAAIAQKDGLAIGQRLYNDLERIVLPEHPQVTRLKEQFQQAGVLGTMMSGSGPTVFALVDSKHQAQTVQEQVKANLADPDLDFWVTRFTNTGIRLATPARVA